ncbi:MAG: hypothetical protein HYX24_05155 [Candidatus Aenigmarchaeota archaeon]|nr:hypothetical protein [Candidatus Aenigmarchaeota archaeon]
MRYRTNDDVKIVAGSVLDEIRKRGQDGMPLKDLLDYTLQVIETQRIRDISARDVVRYLTVGEFVTSNLTTGVYVPTDESMELLLGCMEDEIKKRGKEGMGIRDAGKYLLEARRELEVDVAPIHVFEILTKRDLIQDDLRDQKTVYVHTDVARSY